MSAKQKIFNELISRAKSGALKPNEAERLKAAAEKMDMQFLHNTSADKLARISEMGGMPMPSIGVTRSEIPFEGFGDITLVGNPKNFDPKASKLNQAFSADAYTVRAPQPVQVANKKAGKTFDERYGSRLKDLGVYTDETIANIWDLEIKGDADPSRYRQVVDFIDDRMVPLYAQERGIKLDPKDYDAVSSIKNSSDYTDWTAGVKEEVFKPESYFISNPDRDHYSTNARLKPYNAEELTKFMKRSAGRGTEGGMATKSAGGVRASTTEELKSLQGMKDLRERLVSSEDMAEFKQASDMMLDDLQEAFKGSYKYDSDSWHYPDEFKEFVALSESKGVGPAAREVGFEPSAELIDELSEYKDMLRGGPTEYFESKPKRVVGLEEFGGAIVPEGTPQPTLKMLEAAGMRIEPYADDAGRLAARKKFQDMMFTGGGAAILGGSLLPQDAAAWEQAAANRDVGSISAPTSPRATKLREGAEAYNDYIKNHPLLSVIAPEAPEELLRKIEYGDKRTPSDYFMAALGMM